jgi:predicted phosphodiesterase
MRINVISDCHVRWHRDGGFELINKLQPADVLVIAGDLDAGDNLKALLNVMCDKYPHVVLVAGNHEYYGSSRGAVHQCFSSVASKRRNLHFLNNGTVTIEGQRFVGTTLWWWADEFWVRQNIAKCLNDFNQIAGYAGWLKEANDKAVKFLTKTVQSDDVVVTHHAPSAVFDTHQAYHTELMSPYPKVALPKVWAFGHTHNKVYDQIGHTLFVNEPFGYLGTRECSYSTGRVIEL